MLSACYYGVKSQNEKPDFVKNRTHNFALLVNCEVATATTLLRWGDECPRPFIMSVTSAHTICSLGHDQMRAVVWRIRFG